MAIEGYRARKEEKFEGKELPESIRLEKLTRLTPVRTLEITDKEKMVQIKKDLELLMAKLTGERGYIEVKLV